MMDRKTAALLVHFLLSGCVAGRGAPAPVAVDLPDGTKGYAMHCSGSDGKNSDCANQASQVCSGLYAVVDPAPGDEHVHRTLVVRCLPP